LGVFLGRGLEKGEGLVILAFLEILGAPFVILLRGGSFEGLDA